MLTRIERKREIRKNRNYITTSYISGIVLIICLIFVFIGLKNSNLRIGLGVLAFLSMCTVFFSMLFSMKQDMIIAKYKKDVYEKRQCIYFNICIDSFESNEDDKLKFIFNNLLKADFMRTFILGMATAREYLNPMDLDKSNKAKETLKSLKRKL